MNWLERARREIRECARRPTAVTAERTPTAVLAVPPPPLCGESVASIGSNGSTPPARMLKTESVREDFEDRAAIMEFDGGLARDEAEREAWALVSKNYRLH